MTLEDYLKPFVKIKPESETLILKILALIFGLGCVLLTFLVELLGPGVLQASLTIFGVVGGPLLGLFTLGMLTLKANQKGALTGLVTSLAFLFWIGFGGPKPAPVPLPTFTNGTNCTSEFTKDAPVAMSNSDYFYPYCISYAWFAMLGTFITFFVGLTVSILIPNKEEPTNEHILLPTKA